LRVVVTGEAIGVADVVGTALTFVFVFVFVVWTVQAADKLSRMQDSVIWTILWLVLLMAVIVDSLDHISNECSHTTYAVFLGFAVMFAR
jgi:uncharacterized membrane protein YoaK (UPF0700 family)